MKRDIGGIITEYQTFGNGEPIVVLHGWGEGKKRWLPVAELLAEQNLRVLVADLPGFGNTPVPDEVWGVEEYAEFVRLFIDAVVGEPVMILAHSFGGQVATCVSDRYPDVVKGMVLVAPALVREPSRSVRLVSWLSGVARGLVTPLLPRVVLRPIRSVLYRLLGTHDYPETSGTKREIFQRVIRQDMTKIFARRTCPILLVWGTQDRQVSEREIKRLIELNPRLDVVVIEAAGHDVPFTHTERVIEELTSWQQRAYDLDERE